MHLLSPYMVLHLILVVILLQNLHNQETTSHLTYQNFYFVEETASNLVRFQYQEGGGVFEDRSSGKGDEQDG